MTVVPERRIERVFARGPSQLGLGLSNLNGSTEAWAIHYDDLAIDLR
jgi:hypothetical protein